MSINFPSTPSAGDFWPTSPSVSPRWQFNGVQWGLVGVASTGGVANLSIANRGANTLDILSDTGTDVTIPASTITEAGLATASQIIKLSGIATGATVNSTDAQLRDRTTHTGTQPTSTITGLGTYLSVSIASTTYQPFSTNLTGIGLSSSSFYLSRTNHTGTQPTSTITGLGTYQPLSTNLTGLGLSTPGFYLDRANHTGTQSWNTIISTPTSIVGYGITDVLSVSIASTTYQPLSTNLTGIGLSPSSFYLSRANHTGTQPTSTITGLSTYLDRTNHTGTQPTSTITGLSTYLSVSIASTTYQPLSTNLTGIGLSASSFYLNRTNHTGTQPTSTITGLGTYQPLTSIASTTQSGLLSNTDKLKIDNIVTSSSPVFIGHTEPSPVQLNGATKYIWWDTSTPDTVLWIEDGL